MKVYYLPLEPIDTRYTKQWYVWFAEVFRDEGIEFEYIDGEQVESKVGSEFFLDMKNTFVWKFEQLKRLFKKDMEDGDIVFIPDGEYPGIEALVYFAKFYNKKIKIYEIWHAGTYDYWDLTNQFGLARWGKDLEEVWMDMADKIFVATSFHKRIILESRRIDENKVVVTGLPVDVEGLKKYKSGVKEYDIVFTGRLVKEKGYDVVKKLKSEGWQIHCTMDYRYEKSKYYEVLGRSRIVFAPSLQETFGYGVVEAMSMDVIPIVKGGLAFDDYVPKENRYYNEDEMYALLYEFVGDKVIRNFHKYVEKYQYQKVIKRMLKEMGL